MTSSQLVEVKVDNPSSASDVHWVEKPTAVVMHAGNMSTFVTRSTTESRP